MGPLGEVATVNASTLASGEAERPSLPARLMERRPALAIVATYVAFGAAWILLEFSVAPAVISDPVMLDRLRAIGRWAFVGLSAVLLLVVIERAFGWARRDRADEPAITELLQGVEEERNLLARQVAESQKMAAVGRIASGVAHDFNNMLNLILGYAHFLEADLSEDDPRRAEVTEIGDAAERASVLARQLLSFSRNGSGTHEMSLNGLVEDMKALLDRAAGMEIEVTLSLDPDTPLVRARRSDIERVLMNLILNAKDAMSDGGRIEIRTGASGGNGPAEALLAVSDEGSGIPPGVLPRIFEPFLTTKSNGKGTGLGLWTARELVEGMGGRIEVDSRPERGTTFYILLPGLNAKPRTKPPGTAQRVAGF